jgi:hypothetical protein
MTESLTKSDREVIVSGFKAVAEMRMRMNRIAGRRAVSIVALMLAASSAPANLDATHAASGAPAAVPARASAALRAQSAYPLNSGALAARGVAGRAACVREGEACDSPEATCCAGLVCIGRSRFCASKF